MASAYILLALGVVLGAAAVLAIQLWRKALEDRKREQYFSDVRTLARGGR